MRTPIVPLSITFGLLAACGEVKPTFVDGSVDAPAGSVTLTVAKSGAGVVTSSPAGLVCGSVCTLTLPVGTEVTLTATAEQGASLSGWSGACAGSASTCTLTLTADASVEARFSAIMRTVTVAVSGNGTGTVRSTPDGISCPGTCTMSVADGAQVSLTAAPGAMTSFLGWSGGACTGTGACALTVTSDVTVNAPFALDSSLVVTRSGNGAAFGRVTSTPGGITCGTDCDEVYPAGTMVTLAQSVGNEATFTGWSGACTGTGACTVAINAAQTVDARFTLRRYTLMVATTGGGNGIVSSTPNAGISCGNGNTDCSEDYDHGASVTLEPAAAGDSLFTGWSGACTGMGACTVAMTQARSVTASFQRSVTVRTAVTGGIAGTSIAVTSPTAGALCSGSQCRIPVGGSAAATAPTLTDWFFNGWTGGATGAAAAITVPNVTADLVITAGYINMRQEPCRDAPPANGATTSRPMVTTTYTTARGWTQPAQCPWACNLDYCQSGASACVLEWQDQLAYNTGSASKWFGGDNRPNTSRSVGTGQSVVLTGSMPMQRFGFLLTGGFTYSTTGAFGTNPNTVRLDRRDANGTIVATYTTTLPANWPGGWLYWTTGPTTLGAGTHIFTSYLTTAFAQPVDSGSAGDANAGFSGGAGFTGEVPSGDLNAWNSWTAHPWDFKFRIQTRNAQCN